MNKQALPEMEQIVLEKWDATTWNRTVKLASGKEVNYEGFAPLVTSISIRDIKKAIEGHVVDGDVLPGVALVYDEDIFQLWKVNGEAGVISLRTYLKNHHPQIKQMVVCYPESTHTW